MNIIYDVIEFKCHLIEPVNATVLVKRNLNTPYYQIQVGDYSIPILKMCYADEIAGYLQVINEETITTAHCIAEDN